MSYHPYFPNTSKSAYRQWRARVAKRRRRVTYVIPPPECCIAPLPWYRRWLIALVAMFHAIMRKDAPVFGTTVWSVALLGLCGFASWHSVHAATLAALQ